MATENHSKEKDTAIVAITRQGAALGRRLQQELSGSVFYVRDKFAGEPSGAEIPFTGLKELVADIFKRYRYLALIMAAGIAVRLVSGELKDKHRDPGIIVIDDAGTFCISLLSGHIGGANEMAEKIASLIGAQPVITTASDVNKTISLDLLGREYGWKIEDDTYLKSASAALVNKEPVGVFQDSGETAWQEDKTRLPENVEFYPSLEALIRAAPAAAIVITDRILEPEVVTALPQYTVIYRPKSLVLGIGCNRGISCAAIENAVQETLNSASLQGKCVKLVATIDVKKDETGLLKYMRDRELYAEYHGRESLRKTRFPSPPSPEALKNVGTPSVCEAAALLSGRAEELIVPKVKFGRAVTVAVARYVPPNDTPKDKGKLYIVGTGPGDLKSMTFAARDAIDRSEVILGYKTYIDLIKPLLSKSKLVIATGMGAELERVKTSIALAVQGKSVALISGGDSGIYGMSGPVGEFLLRQPASNIEVKVIPGVPALAAAASLLGSPISGDFTAVSLSDYLVPWERICRRLDAASREDFVIVLYNPKSRKRPGQLSEAIGIITRYRPEATVAGIVKNACRPGQSVRITDLGRIEDGNEEIDMNTIIIIGNGSTAAGEKWMATPRGYHKKYAMPEKAVQI